MSQARSFHFGHAVPNKMHHRKRDSTSCSTGGFYKGPTSGQTVQGGSTVDISWDPSCISGSSAVDIYLLAPSLDTPRIHVWEGVDAAPGTYQTVLKPKWWNSTDSISLQLTIVPTGTPLFMTTLPAGPVFTASYTSTSGAVETDADTTTPDATVQVVGGGSSSSGLPSGKVAAAVIMPLLVVIAILVAYYIRRKRVKTKEEHKRFSQVVDKRMSTISTDWKAMSAAGASAAIRNSIAVSSENGGGIRASSFSFGAIRPASTISSTNDGGQAGIGIRGILDPEKVDYSAPHMSQLRPSVRAAGMGERVSRVSFANDPRPSGESRRTIAQSRAFHVGVVPPVPTRQSSGDMSPTQASGPLSLTIEDITTRMSRGSSEARPSMDEVYPALSLMRTGTNDTGLSNDDLLFDASAPFSPLSPNLPSPPTPSFQAARSSMSGMSMQPMPASVMSPDEMLRAYAAGRAAGATLNGPAMPTPVANYNGNGMRTLYSPTTPNSAAPMMTPGSLYPSRKSTAPTVASKYEEDDVYAGVGI